MKTHIFLFVALLALGVMTGCRGDGKGDSPTAADSTSVTLQYAKGFTVKQLSSGVRLVEVCDPQRELDPTADSKTFRFALIPRGSSAVAPHGYAAVEVPISATICMTALQLSNFTALNAHDLVRGITSTKNLYNSDILSRVESGEIVKIGSEGDFNQELIMAANPDVIFISPFKRGGYEAIKETCITLVPHLGYKELDPLGQAEWIKFVAMFIGKEAQANAVFNGIVERYNAAKELAANAVATKEQTTATDSNAAGKANGKASGRRYRRPTVFSGEMHGGNWYAVGGRSTLAQIFRDAGAEYILKDDMNTGGIPMEWEQMYAAAADADYWRILNSHHGSFSYKALAAIDPRNADFKAFRRKAVIYCNMRSTPYYELAPVAPDLLLMDFVAIFHPEAVPADYQPTFYTLLK